MERRRVRPASGTAGPARAFLLTLAVGLLAGLLLGLLVGFFLGRIRSGGGGGGRGRPSRASGTHRDGREDRSGPRGDRPRAGEDRTGDHDLGFGFGLPLIAGRSTPVSFAFTVHRSAREWRSEGLAYSVLRGSAVPSIRARVRKILRTSAVRRSRKFA